jgi:hypothetical protein
MNANEFETLRRQMAKDIMRYLHSHSEVMAINQNKEVYEYVRDLRIKQAMKNNPQSSYEDVAFAIDLMCNHESKRVSPELEFDQATINCFRPDADQNAEYYRVLFEAILAYKKQKNSKRSE